MKTLVYGFDPLCGWCFAFRDVIRELRTRLFGKVNWEVACGGLVTGERIQPIGRTRDYLLQGEQMLIEAAGVRFGSGFHDGLLAEGTWVSQSEPACRATLIAQALAGGQKAIDFGDELSRGFYVDGSPPDAPESLTRAADRAGIDARKLLTRWEAGPDATAAEMEAVREAGVGVYPSLYTRVDDRLRVIYKGFATADQLVRMM